MKTHSGRTLVLMAALMTCFLGATSFAVDLSDSTTSSSKKQRAGQSEVQRQGMTPEARKKMAEMHKKMADCLNSSKSMQECRNEMRSSMRALHDEGYCEDCGMMGGMMGGMRGHDHDDDDHCW